MVCAGLMTYLLSTAKEAFELILSIGAGTGLLYLLRWFWWRVSAWCEIVAMVMSLITSLAVPYFMPGASFATTTIVQVGITTVAWLITAFVGPTTDRATLIESGRRRRAACGQVLLQAIEAARRR